MKNDIRAKYSYTLGKWVVTMQGKIVDTFDDLDNAKAYKADLQRFERVKRATKNIYHQGLLADLDKLKNLEPNTRAEKGTGYNIRTKYAIYVQNGEYQYTYSSKRFRDYDYARLKRIAPQLNFLN